MDLSMISSQKSQANLVLAANTIAFTTCFAVRAMFFNY